MCLGNKLCIGCARGEAVWRSEARKRTKFRVAAILGCFQSSIF